jgi:hypothetical protein
MIDDGRWRFRWERFRGFRDPRTYLRGVIWAVLLWVVGLLLGLFTQDLIAGLLGLDTVWRANRVRASFTSVRN